jgi:hypothetical protein
MDAVEAMRTRTYMGAGTRAGLVRGRHLAASGLVRVHNVLRGRPRANTGSLQSHPATTHPQLCRRRHQPRQPHTRGKGQHAGGDAHPALHTLITSSAASVFTSATMQPPKPPPVICTRTRLAHPRGRTPQAACKARHRADRAQKGAARKEHLSHCSRQVRGGPARTAASDEPACSRGTAREHPAPHMRPESTQHPTCGPGAPGTPHVALAPHMWPRWHSCACTNTLPPLPPRVTHPSAVHAAGSQLFPSVGHKRVQLRRGHLEVLGEGVVGAEHELAHLWCVQGSAPCGRSARGGHGRW